MTATKNPTRPKRDVVSTVEQIGKTKSNGRAGTVDFYIFTLTCGHTVRAYASQGRRKEVRCKECPILSAV